MRIIGGEFKRRNIFFPKTKLTRPVTDRAKETMFNILGERVEGRRVLDLYAGSGSLGLESLSRGAASATFVDHGQESIQCIRKNLADLGLTAKAEVLGQDIEKTLKQLEKRGKTYDLIFLDPPHNKGLIKIILNLLDASAIMNPYAIIVVGHSRLEELPAQFISLFLERSTPIGQTYISYLVKGEKQ